MKNEALPPGDRSAELKKNSTRNDIIAAYEAYQRQEPLSLDNLLKVVTQFAYTKVYHLEHDFREFGSYETADDWAQEVAIKVWLALKDGKFEGNGESFYSWIHKIAFNRAADAFNDLKDAQAHKEPLTVTFDGHDGDDEEEERDNPEIHSSSQPDETWVGDGVDEKGEVQYKKSIPRSSGTVHIPESVKGKDYLICIMIIDGLKQAEIAAKMGITLNAVKKRLQKLRKRLAPELERERNRAQYADRHRTFKIVRPGAAAIAEGTHGQAETRCCASTADALRPQLEPGLSELL